MSILSSFKKALGFPDEYDEDNDALESDNERPTPVAKTECSPVTADPAQGPAVEKAIQASSNDSAPSTVELIHSELPGEVLDAVIEQFNSIQPEFVRQCLSVETQRAYLIDRMSAALREKLRQEMENAHQAGLKQCESERAKMAMDIERMKSDRVTIKQQKEEFKNAQLSATRQKRALNERIRDLEAQVAQLEADKEQYQLENRGLINKLRVAGIKSNVSDGSDAEIDRLAQENVSLQDRIKSLESELMEAQTAAQAAPAEELQQEMINEIEQRMAEFEEIKKKKDNKINQLGKDLNEARKANSVLKKKIEDLNNELPKTSEAHEKETDQLRAEIKRLTELINAAEQSTGNIHAGRKRKRRNKSEEIPAQQPEPEALPAPTPLPEEIKDRPKISAIDELMDSTDWFTAPDPIPLKKDPEVEEQFGYKEPQRKPTHHDDKQLSLF